MTVAEAIFQPQHRRAHKLMNAHFRGDISPGNERWMRGHLLGCAGCRKHYERHLHLAAVDPCGRLPARDRLARGLGLLPGPSRTRVPSLTAWTAIPATAFVFLLGLGMLWRSSETTPSLQARGDSPSLPSQLLVYEISRGGPVRKAIGKIRRDSALAFAYVNTAQKQRLMIFGVDEDRRVLWYQPAWTDARDNPVAVPVATDVEVHEIPQAVTHPLRGRTLQVFGAFGDQPLTVREVEAAVKRANPDADGRLQVALPGWDLIRFQLALAEATP
ncbi:MAG TPA: zf-HC2 domain-containing protein [Polyangia bacterium]